MVLEFNKNFYQRILTIVLTSPIVFFCVYMGDYWSKILIIIFSIFLSNEWFKLTQKNNLHYENLIFVISVFLNLVISLFLDFTFSLLLTIFISFYYCINFRFKNFLVLQTNIWLFYGFIYICVPLIIFNHVQSLNNGVNITLWFLITIFSTDIFSYIFGNLIKTSKIVPSISPSKSYSGTVLGIITGSLCGFLFSLKYLYISNVLSLVYFTLIISFSAFIGDLLISKLKRFFRVKDSGKSLPGHGGFLDRYDSISFGLIILFFLVYYL